MGCHVLLSLTFLTLLLSTSDSTNAEPYAGGVSIQMINVCYSTIYPSVFTKKGHRVTPTGLKLDHLDVYDLKVPDSWSGTIWAQASSSNTNNTTFHCDVGECGSSHVKCHDHKTRLPVTLMKFKLAPKGGISFYILDLSYGFNVPVTISPLDNQCKHITCSKDLRFECPDLLAMYDDEGVKIACKNACYATHEPKFCCTGAYAVQEKCQVNEYTKLVMNECPDAVYNVFNQTLFTCFGGISYVVMFCP